MPNHQDIQPEALKLTREAEIGRPADLQHVHQELQKDMDKYTASDYGNLLKGIRNQNDADVKANAKLPTLEISDNGSGGVPGTVRANYADGTTMTANGKAENLGTAGTAGGGAESEGMNHAAQHNSSSPSDFSPPQQNGPCPSDYSPPQHTAPPPSDQSPPQQDAPKSPSTA